MPNMDKGFKHKFDHKDGDQNLSRRQARRFALQVLFANEFLKEDIQEVSERIADTLGNDVITFSNDIIEKTHEHQCNLDTIITSGLVDRNLDRVPLLEKVLIRMALCELLYFPDIPIEVTLNEAVDLSKEFTSIKSSRFINGILDTLVKMLEKDRKIKKDLLARLPSSKVKHQKIV